MKYTEFVRSFFMMTSTNPDGFIVFLLPVLDDVSIALTASDLFTFIC